MNWKTCIVSAFANRSGLGKCARRQSTATLTTLALSNRVTVLILLQCNIMLGKPVSCYMNISHPPQGNSGHCINRLGWTESTQQRVYKLPRYQLDGICGKKEQCTETLSHKPQGLKGLMLTFQYQTASDALYPWLTTAILVAWWWLLSSRQVAMIL